jgi:hypothetical protein
MSSVPYNDIPGELKDKIKLWDVLHRILLQNGFADFNNITSDLANLKTQLNSLLSEVLGVEHDIDGIHNYDDTNLKHDITNITNQITNVTNDITMLVGKLNSYTSTPSQTLVTNDNEITLSTMNSNNIGTRVIMTKNQIALQAMDKVTGTAKVHGQVALGGDTDISGVDISSDFDINISNRDLQTYVNLKYATGQVNQSDVNGIRITPYNNTGILFQLKDQSKSLILNWVN